MPISTVYNVSQSLLLVAALYLSLLYASHEITSVVPSYFITSGTIIADITYQRISITLET